jgi:hypothetical protein
MNLRAVSRLEVHVSIAEVGDGLGGVIFDKAVAASVSCKTNNCEALSW